MGSLLSPKTYMVGSTALDMPGIRRYLRDTGQEKFLEDIAAAEATGVSDGEILSSMYAKLCYASLVEGKNLNISKTRSIHANVIATLDHGHGSVFEHCWINFITHNCSRVFTHELVRHRVGTAFSQTSGRYVRTDVTDLVFDPILDPIKDMVDGKLAAEEVWHLVARIKLGLYESEEELKWFKANVKHEGDIPPPIKDMRVKKKLTSALRRLAIEGRPNEMGWSLNLRAARHMIQLRTSPDAEWEIRLIFGQVFEIMRHEYPLMFADAQTKKVDGLIQVYGMRIQPYELRVES